MKNLFMVFLILTTLKVVADDVVNPFKAEIREDQNILLLNNGLASLEERLQMVERAQKSIDVEYFIYRPDKAGRIFTHALIKRADEGIKVRMLLDYFMVKKELSPFYANELIKHGIEIKYYNPTATIDLFNGQFRNHRKTLMIDGKEFITGGRNLADEYFDLSETYNFLDRDIKVEGNLVKSVQATFDEMWSSPLSKVVARARMPLPSDAKYSSSNDKTSNGASSYYYDISEWKKRVAEAVEFVTVPMDETFEKNLREKARANLASEYSGICNDMQFNSEYPVIGSKAKAVRMIKYEIADRIKTATKSIIFDSPYFVMDNTSTDALETALDKKIDVTLITNSLYSSDAVYVSTAFNSIIKKWIAKGLKPYVLDGKKPEDYESLSQNFADARVGVHAKSYVFDNKDVIIGTFNFDPRSANLNAEMTVSCNNNPGLASAVSSDMQMRMKSSMLLDSAATADKLKFYNVGFIKIFEYTLLKFPSSLVHFLL